MGQRIEVTATMVGDVVVLDTDRSLTGQDGGEYGSAEEAAADPTFPGRLAHRIYEEDGRVEQVFVASNSVVVRRSRGWDDEAVADLERVVAEFFLFYPAA
jgi:hypothetical protein